MNRTVFFALSAVACMVLLAQGSGALVEAAGEPAPEATATARAKAMSARNVAEEGPTIINRDSSGQFHLNAKLNGEEAPFLVDTGADIVALTVATAEAARLPVDPSNFQPLMQTASGTGNGARFVVDEFHIAGREFRDVEVVVLEGLDTNLLGQSLLKKLGRVELKGDRMVIGHD